MELRAVAVTFVGDTVLESVDGEAVTWEKTIVKPDKFKALLGDGLARVSIGVGEKMGGPRYSSIDIRVNVTLTCDQSEAGIREAEKIGFDEACSFLDTSANEVVQLLNAHLSRLPEAP